MPMVQGDVITIEASLTLPDPETYSLKTETTTLRVNDEYIKGQDMKI